MEQKETVATYAAERAKEPTTWAGIIQAAAGIYIAVASGDMNTAVAGIGVILTSLISIFSKQKK